MQPDCVVGLDDPGDHRPGLGEVLQFVLLDLLADGAMVTLDLGIVRRRVRPDLGVRHARRRQRLDKVPSDKTRTMIALDVRPNVTVERGQGGGGLDRGYAVLSVNYRGSTGLGKDFINASNYEWAGKMHDDLLDAVKWAIDNGITRKDQVAIMGGSYGGYAALVGLTFTPETFACGVDIVGPSNLVTLLSTIPPYWAPMLDLFTKRIGDHRTEEGRKLLLERSPLTRVDQIRKPLLIGQGANDPRVKQAESDQIVSAMKKRSIPVTYVLYSDEGHGFARPENRTSFNAVAESFLAKHLGGRFEPMGDDMSGSSITIVEGAEDILGLPESLKKR